MTISPIIVSFCQFTIKVRRMEEEIGARKEFSLKGMVKERFSKLVTGIMAKVTTKEMVLVLDNYTITLISNLMGFNELIGLGLTVLEKIQLKRKPLEMHALYFVQPREANIQLIIDDFKEAPTYSKIHILFPYKCPTQTLNTLSLDERIIKKLRTIKEFHHSCFFVEKNVVTMKLDYLELSYSDFNSKREKKLRDRLSSKFLQIFRSLESFHQVNLYFKKSTSGVAERVAESIAIELKEFTNLLIREKSHLLNEESNNVEVLILDRSIDPVTPLLHDFFYQAMLFDLLDFKLSHLPSKQQKESPESIPLGLNQIDDQAYNKYRYHHFADVLEQLPQDILDLSKKVKHSTSQTLLELDINITKKYETQMRLVRRCDDTFKAKNLAEIGELEQSLATGIDIDGAETSSVKLIQQAKQWLQTDTITEQEKTRIALILYCCISLSEKDYKRLLKSLPQSEHKLFVKMLWLGITLSMETKRSTKNIRQNIRKIAEDKLNKHNMNLSRYSSIVELILPVIAKGLMSGVKIDEDIFGMVVVNRSDKGEVKEVRGREKDHRKREKIGVEQGRGKRTMVVLFVGGGSYAEIRAIKNLDLQQQMNVIVVADMFMTPQEYIDAIGNMKQPK